MLNIIILNYIISMMRVLKEKKCLFSVQTRLSNLEFLNNRIDFKQRDKLLPVFKHGFLKSEEHLNLNNIKHKMVSQCCCAL